MMEILLALFAGILIGIVSTVLMLYELGFEIIKRNQGIRKH